MFTAHTQCGGYQCESQWNYYDREYNPRLSVIRLALGGVDRKPIVLAPPGGSIEQLVQAALAPLNPPSNYFATAEYRREMIGVLVKRVLSRVSAAPAMPAE